MKILQRMTVLSLMLILAFGFTTDAKKARKLPDSAYIKAAKIEIISGDKRRYANAIALLDSLFMHYGPHSEALHLMSQVYVDYIDKSSTPAEKKPYIIKMVAYVDSLHMACENKDIKKKYRKNCENYAEKSDSTKVKFWREYYNAGVEQLDVVRELSKDLEGLTDSSDIDYTQTTMDENIDSCIANMELAIIIDPTIDVPYIATSSAYKFKKDLPSANEWLVKSLDKVENREDILLSIAYNYFDMDDFCGAIPYIKEYTEMLPENINGKVNLSVSYNNCGKYDSSVFVYRDIIALNPTDTVVLSSILSGMSRFFILKAQDQGDSAKFYREQEDNTIEEKWKAEQDNSIDSILLYNNKIIEISSEDIIALGRVGLYSFVKSDYLAAIIAYKQLTELEPENVDNWTYLGDCNIYQKLFKDAIPAYEGVVKLEPENKEIWEKIRDLYIQTGNRTKAAEIDKKLKAMK